MQLNITSQTFKWLRFPLIFAVIWGHVDHYGLIGLNPDSWAYSVYFFITQLSTRFTVPTFFVISGYFFFFNKQGPCVFTPAIYKQKIRKRIRSLLIPYLFWNLAVLLLKIVTSHNTTEELVSMTVGFPYPPALQFWFIRDLMIMVLISPLLYLALKYLKHYFIILLWLLYMLDTGFIFDSQLLFFCFGGYFAVNDKDIVPTIRNMRFFPLIIAFVLSIADAIVNTAPTDTFHAVVNNTYIHHLYVTFAVPSVIYIASIIVEKDKIKIPQFLSDSTFILFAVHPIVIVYLIEKPLLMVMPNGNFAFLFTYFFSVLASVVVAGLVYKVLKKYTPSFLSLICGGR